MAIAEDPSEQLEQLVAQYVLGTKVAGVEELQNMAALRLRLSLKRACCPAVVPCYTLTTCTPHQCEGCRTRPRVQQLIIKWILSAAPVDVDCGARQCLAASAAQAGGGPASKAHWRHHVLWAWRRHAGRGHACTGSAKKSAARHCNRRGTMGTASGVETGEGS